MSVVDEMFDRVDEIKYAIRELKSDLEELEDVASPRRIDEINDEIDELECELREKKSYIDWYLSDEGF